MSADVALGGVEAQPVVGSFTSDGLTFAVVDELTVELVGVAEGAGALLQRDAASPSGVAASDASSDPALALAAGDEAEGSVLVLSDAASYEGVDYVVASVGAYAFYLSGVTDVVLPASVSSVDERAFRSSDVASVEVAAGNPALSSYDGVLYSADMTSLLLIPEGRTGAVRVPSHAASVEPSAFSHCARVDAIAVDAGCSHLSSEDGLLYSADGATLLRVPAGATDITIRDGCTTIAAGAMEGCASLATINAPASVTSISPDVFTSVPTVSLPAASVADDAEGSSQAEGAEGAEGDGAPQLTAIVALSSTDDDLPEVGSAGITVWLSVDGEQEPWMRSGFDAKFAEDASEAADNELDADAIFLDTAAVATASYDVPGNASDLATAEYRSLVPVEQWSGYHNGVNNPASFMGMNTKVVNGSYYSPSIRSGSQWQKYSSSVYGGGYIMRAGTSGYYFGYVYPRHYGVLLSAVSTAQNSGFITGTTNASAGWWLHFNTVARFRANGGTWPDAMSPYFKSDTEWRFGAAPYRVNDERYVAYYGEFDPEGIIDVYYSDFDVEHSLYGPDANGQAASLSGDAVLPTRENCVFVGWSTDPNAQPDDPTVTMEVSLSTSTTYYAVWRQDFNVSFDTSSEPGDDDYPGDEREDEVIEGTQVNAGEKIEVEDPKRPGYVFQGWVIPNAEGTEAIDQDLVYKDEADGKWYVDASKLPDYATDGRVELTARWTSVISVDVPSAVTFYADVVTEGQESREGAASSAFGQNKVASQSEVDLRIVGLESTAVETQGSTLGADSILKKGTSATPSSSTQKLFSLYPTSKALTSDDLQDPDAVSTAKPADAVDFALDDILLEKSFAADKFTIPAGDTLNLGYRLNLSETGTELDYDKLSTLDEGQSASIANISYCFAADYDSPADWGEPLWIENPDASEGAPRFLVLDDIKAAADDLSAHADEPTQSEYYALYKDLLDRQVMENGVLGEGPYFQLKVDGAVNGYLDLQLIGICQDTKSDGTGKAGLTFQTRDIYAYNNTKSIAAGGDAFNFTYMNSVNTNSGGWASYAMRNTLRTTFWGYLPERMQAAIVGVDKYHQLYGGSSASYLQKTTNETIWLPSFYEVFGVSFANYNEAEALTSVSGYKPFQYIAYQGGSGSAVNNRAVKTYNGSVLEWWLRSADRSGTVYCSLILSNGGYGGYHATSHAGTTPCFCL